MSEVDLLTLNSSNTKLLNKVLLVSDGLKEVHHRQINVTQVKNNKLSQHEYRHKDRPSFNKDPDGFSTILGCFIIATSACNLPRSPSVTILSIRVGSFIQKKEGYIKMTPFGCLVKWGLTTL